MRLQSLEIARFHDRALDGRHRPNTYRFRQQKVVVARWMEANVRLLIFAEPTIGVDVGSKAEMYRDQVADDLGRAVLLISSDFDEVEKVCHRALIFSRGKLIAEIDRKNIMTPI